MNNQDDNRNQVERTLLAEVENWLNGSAYDFGLTKCAALGFYKIQLDEREGGFQFLVELSLAEARIFNRHVTFPATKADLQDLFGRLRIAKFKALIS